MKESVGRLVAILHRQAQIYMNHSLQPHDITASEYPFLMYLSRHDGAIQEEISVYLYIDKAATTRCIRSLEKKGFLVRHKDSGDRRCNRVFLTPRGKELEPVLRQAAGRFNDFLLESLPDEDQDRLITYLKDMVDLVDRSRLKEVLK